MADADGEVAPSCVFPQWLTRLTWRDLAGKHLYSTDESGEVLTVASSSSHGHVTNSFRCVGIRTGNTAQTHTLALSFASEEWLVSVLRASWLPLIHVKCRLYTLHVPILFFPTTDSKIHLSDREVCQFVHVHI